MRASTLQFRSLVHHRRTHAATVLAVAVATSVLVGSLVVGDSMRASLRSHVLARLGPVDHALASPRFFTRGLCDSLASDPRLAGARTCPAIVTTGNVESPGNGGRANGITVIGIDEQANSFWKTPGLVPPERGAALNRALADRLGVNAGDDIIVRIPRHESISPETLLGRRDRLQASIRLSVADVVPMDGAGGFSLRPGGGPPLNAFLNLGDLQRTLKRRDRVNTLLVSQQQPVKTSTLQETLRVRAGPADLGLGIEKNTLQSESLLIAPPVEAAAIDAARATGLMPEPVLIHLANSIRIARPDSQSSGSSPADEIAPEVPYSVVAAVGHVDGLNTPLGADELALTDWAAESLGARVGDTVCLSYYLYGGSGQLDTATATLRIARIVDMTQASAFRSAVPKYEGMTDAKRISDWDPPFPIDLERIKPADEAYWDEYGPTPKAFVSLETGRQLWAAGTKRLGQTTSIRLAAGTGDKDAQAAKYLETLTRELSPDMVGLVFQPMREQALAAAEGSTDFGMLFVAFSFFLVIAATTLIALVFRLSAENRAGEIGTLLAIGFAPRRLRRLMLAEGLILAATGAVVGTAGAVGYAGAMLALLATWWPPQMGVTGMSVSLRPLTIAGGVPMAVLIATLAMAWALRGLTQISPARLLAGGTQVDSPLGQNRGRAAWVWAILATGLAVALAIAAQIGSIPQTTGFFGSGSAMLVACMAALLAWLRAWSATAVAPASSPSDAGIQKHRRDAGATPIPGRALGCGAVTRGIAHASDPLAQLGIRNACRRPRRSLLIVGLVACATFIVVAVGANRREHHASPADRNGGTGGFALVGESTLPILGPLEPTRGAAATMPAERIGAHVYACRLRPGDDTSCLNLYQPARPRVVGVPEAFISRGGFQFASSLPGSKEETANPWRLLQRTFENGAVPAIADESTVLWLLKSGLNRDVTITDERGQTVLLRFVALLAGSMLQSEIVISEPAFRDLFPSIAGHGFFLIEAAAADAQLPGAIHALGSRLESTHADHGLVVRPAADRLAAYAAVENTYLSTFQLLGGLGVVLGTIGMAAVLARNVLEQRKEFALLEAVGFRRGQIRRMLLAENTALLVAGLGAGCLSAVIAVIPGIRGGAGPTTWLTLAGLIIATMVVGLLAAAITATLSLRGPLVRALRND